ncbi:MAG: hybrid sensor histidine kinase/response regulator [Fulvimarina sp.]|nr:hybrid sensor histidine kinase/response regulator [Fulvimarina sp.]
MSNQLRFTGDRISDQTYRLLVDGMAEYAIILLTAQGTIGSWNAGAERLKGFCEEEVLGLDFFDFFFREHRADIAIEDVMRHIDFDGRFSSEGWCRRKNGTRFWAHVTLQAVTDEDEGRAGYVAICRDRTMRRSAEGASQRNEARFRQLIEGFRDHAICMLDPEGRIGSWGGDLERLLGYARHEIVGMPFARLFPKDDRGRGLPDDMLQTAVRDGRLQRTGWRLRSDGQRVAVSEVIDVIHGEDGAHAGFAVVMRDMSAQRAAEDALEVTRQALFQSQKLEMIGKLTGGVAHDFNNLLSAILGNLEIGRRRLGPGSNVGPFIDNALVGARRGADMVARMMTFAREQPGQIASVALPELVSGLEDLFAWTIGPGVTVRTEYSSRLAAVEVDPHQLELALMNLLVNARDAMPHGGTIHIRARNRRISAAAAATGGVAWRCVQLAISDTGTGMDAETLARARDLFFTTKAPGKGTGLGLSTVQGFIDAAQGQMLIESVQGKGTTVSLLLPIAKDPARGAIVDDEAEDEDVESSDGRQLRILVVDDDALVLMNTAAMLTELGHEAIEAISAHDALAILSAQGEEGVDLVMTDHAMPSMTGMELARCVSESWPTLPVILATGYAEVGMEVGSVATTRLQKPFGIRDLRATIDSAVTDKQTARPHVSGAARNLPLSLAGTNAPGKFGA